MFDALNTIDWHDRAPTFVAALVLGYVVGSIPFGLLFTWAAGAGDVRLHDAVRRVAAGHARTCTHRLHLCLPSREYPSPRGRPRNPHRREYARARTTMKPRSLSDSERRDWLRLARSQNVGPVTF